MMKNLVGTTDDGLTKNFSVKVVQPVDMNKNTSWFHYPGVWTSYILIIFTGWLIILSLFGCDPGTAWTVVSLIHFLGFSLVISHSIYCGSLLAHIVTYTFFHWKKGTPFAEDQGMYNKLTWWEQMDSGRQFTNNRKFLTIVPLALYLISCHTTNYQNPALFLNTLAVGILVIAKFPNMHKVRILGINADYPS